MKAETVIIRSLYSIARALKEIVQSKKHKNFLAISIEELADSEDNLILRTEQCQKCEYWDKTEHIDSSSGSEPQSLHRLCKRAIYLDCNSPMITNIDDYLSRLYTLPTHSCIEFRSIQKKENRK